MRNLFCLFVLMLFGTSVAQDFFESAGEDSSRQPDLAYELNGFVRGAFFGGKAIDKDEGELKSGYGELRIKMRVRKDTWGDGYAEMQYRRGSEFNESLSEFQLREAYVNTYLSNFDIRIGQQIVVWGRADAFNPTNNVTPQNMLVRSTDEDDRRMGNFLMRASYHWHPVILEMLWVPQYVPSVLPIPVQLFDLPLGVRFDEAINPDAKLKNSSVGIKSDIILSSFEGSLSYFRGYMPMPGVFMKDPEITDDNKIFIPVALKAYKMQVFGFDFSTALSSWGFRGEIAYRKPVDKYKVETGIHIPNPDLQYVWGFDKSIRDFSIILQYVGRYVLEFEALKPGQNLLYDLELKNRILSSQLYEISHAGLMRTTLALLHEVMAVEFLCYYNGTTEEALLRPVIAYDLADALTAKIGGEWYKGPINTLFGTIERALSSAFIELKVSF